MGCKASTQSNKAHNYVNIFRLMLGVTENGTVTAMKKEGSGSLEVSSVEDMLEVYIGTAKPIFRVTTM